jgi:hypothetical protein
MVVVIFTWSDPTGVTTVVLLVGTGDDSAVTLQIGDMYGESRTKVRAKTIIFNFI